MGLLAVLGELCSLALTCDFVAGVSQLELELSDSTPQSGELALPCPTLVCSNQAVQPISPGSHAVSAEQLSSDHRAADPPFRGFAFTYDFKDGGVGQFHEPVYLPLFGR